MDKNTQYQQLAHKYIPGGAHTYSKGDDQYPSNAPKVIVKGEGAYIWDVDGNKFLDYGMALRSVILGYNDKRVANAAIQEILKGNNFTRPSDTEVLAAQEFCEFIPNCDMVKFSKNGSTAVSAAVKLARAYTGKKIIARCSDHPFFSYDDWFIGSTVMSSGIPEEIKALTVQFKFNDAASLERIFNLYPNEIACVLCEPSTAVEPQNGFLQSVVEIAHKHNSIVVFDEMITGFRWHPKGACFLYDVKPDLVTFGKAMGNGFSVAALAGKQEIMNLGGLAHDKERVFLTSTTHGAEMCGLGAMREMLRIYKETHICDHIWSTGAKLIGAANEISRSLGLEKHFYFEGISCSPVYVCKDEELSASLGFRTLFMQEMIKCGVLMPWVSLSYSHSEKDIAFTLNAIEKSLSVYSKALEHGLKEYLFGNSVKPVFRKYN